MNGWARALPLLSFSFLIWNQVGYRKTSSARRKPIILFSYLNGIAMILHIAEILIFEWLIWRNCKHSNILMNLKFMRIECIFRMSPIFLLHFIRQGTDFTDCGKAFKVEITANASRISLQTVVTLLRLKWKTQSKQILNDIRRNVAVRSSNFLSSSILWWSFELMLKIIWKKFECIREICRYNK